MVRSIEKKYNFYFLKKINEKNLWPGAMDYNYLYL